MLAYVRICMYDILTGKYGQDFGLIAEDCFPYMGKDMPCQKSTCQRHYTRDYYYIGGYYGACNEPLMRTELVKNGPIAVSFEVYNDFPSYKVTCLTLWVAETFSDRKIL